MAEFRPFDLGNVLSTGEAIKTSRFNRQAAQEQMDLAKNQMDRTKAVDNLKFGLGIIRAAKKNPQLFEVYKPELISRQIIGPQSTLEDPSELEQFEQQLQASLDAYEPPKWGQPFAANQGGQDVFVQATPTGRTQVVPGIAPRPKQPLVEMNPGEKEETKQWGASLVKHFDEIDSRATNSESQLLQLGMLKNIDAPAGSLEPFKAGVSALAESVGIDPARLGLTDASNAQSYLGVMQNLVLEKMQAQKGPQTENDAKRIEMTVASLGNTKAARDFLLDAAIATEMRNIEKRNFYLQHRQKTGSLDGVRSAWAAYERKRPFMGVNPKSGRPVFYSQFKEAMARQNMPEAQIDKLWWNKYGKVR